MRLKIVTIADSGHKMAVILNAHINQLVRNFMTVLCEMKGDTSVHFNLCIYLDLTRHGFRA